MSSRLSKAAIAVLLTLITYVCVNSLVRALNPDLFIWSEEDLEENEWLATSNSWFDRKACRWLGVCGLAHVKLVHASVGQRQVLSQQPLHDDDDGNWRSDWTNANGTSEDWSDDERVLREIPSYVLEYAPLVHLFSREQFWPGDIAEHLVHTPPRLNYTPVEEQWQHPTLRDLDQLNQWEQGRHVYLTSNENVEDRPDWLAGERNIPKPGVAEPEEPSPGVPDSLDDEPDEDRAEWYDAGEGEDNVGARFKALNSFEEYVDELRKRYGGYPIQGDTRTGGRSDAPAVLVVVDKGHGIIDAFWFYFYSYNLGNAVLNIRFGNHVGDWEHCLVRFYKGKPKALFFSAHTAGEAYSYDAVEKRGKRPVIYSAVGTHAMYATPGIHEYILPWGLLHDETDRGPLWDPLLNLHSYTYNYQTDTLRTSNLSPMAPTEWFYFNGHWGDKFYPLGDRRQYRFAGQYHYVNGPLGPRFKHLGRHKVCQGDYTDPCVIRTFIGEDRRAKRWAAVGTGDELQDEDLQAILDRRAAAMARRG
ncbi:hypothetical protein VTN77DRAFT_1000 [Rasamsonia byssochlamydoides]|uniref:uncharacterized protein n=1 Tax=Rasamsonia byssochlamydoides TaxID=89139 RepID=UPI003742B2ED